MRLQRIFIWVTWVLWVACALQAPLLLAQTQPAASQQQSGNSQDKQSKETDKDDQPLIDRPFRRIFIPQAELPEISLDNLRPMEVDRLPTALERLVRRNSESIDPWVSSTQSLRSIHGVARLVGADLYSERTRLVWPTATSGHNSGSNDSPIREKLSPWNLAIENGLEELNASSSLPTSRPVNEKRTDGDPTGSNLSTTQIPTWLFDSAGRPLLERRGHESWIRWSLRPTAESTPTRLEFQALVPKTVDGCFVLILPKSARIEKSNVVFKKVDAWEQAADRLLEWPNRNPLLGTSAAPSIENSYWILEISGNEKIDFTIEVGSSVARAQVLEPPQGWGIDRIFSKQTLHYAVHHKELRLLSEWDWIETVGNDAPIKIELPSGMKLRSLSLNDREPSLQIEGSNLVVRVPEMQQPQLLGTTSKIRLSAELLIPWASLEKDAAGRMKIPTVGNVNGVVLFGSTILQDRQDGQFVSVLADQARLDFARKSAEGLHRLEYTWNKYPPEIFSDIQTKLESAPVESIVRLATEAQRCIANVRLKLSDARKTSIESIAVPTGWSVDPDSISFRPAISAAYTLLNDVANSIQVDWGRIAGTDTVLEFELSKSLENGGDVSLADLPWITIADQPPRTCYYIEPSSSNRLTFRGRIKSWILTDEELTPWQRDSLPRLGKPIVLGSRGNKIPPVIATSLEESLVVPIETKVRRTATQWRVEHRFRISPEWSEFAEIRIKLPGHFQWYYDSTQRFPLAASYNSEAGEWVLQLNSLDVDQEIESLGSIVATMAVESQLPKLELQQPSINEAKRLVYQLDLEDNLVVRYPDEKTARRKSDSHGYIYEWIDNEPESTGIDPNSATSNTIEILDTSDSNKGSIAFYDSRLDLFIDGFGAQGAELSTRIFVPIESDGELTLKHPQQWQVTDCFLSDEGKTLSASMHKISSTQTRIAIDPSRLHSRPRLGVRLAGPKIQTENQTRGIWTRIRDLWSSKPIVLIEQPVFGFEQGKLILSNQTLWFPKSLSIRRSSDREDSTGFQIKSHQRDSKPVNPNWGWPIWDWTEKFWDAFAPDRRIRSDGELVSTVTPPIDPPGILPPGNWNGISLNPFEDTNHFEVELSRRSAPKLSGWITVFSALITASWFRRRPKVLVFLAVACWLGAIWLAYPIGNLCTQLFTGIALGGILLRLYQIISPTVQNSPTSIRSDRSSTWDPKGDSEGLELAKSKDRRSGSMPVAIWFPWILAPVGLASILASHTMTGFSQDPQANSAKVFDILIPINQENELAGTTIYVPEELLTLIETEEREKRLRDSIAMLGASKHLLRLDSRSFGFGNADQPFTSTYEMWISDAAVGRAVRIPFPSDTLKLSRFSVDGTEVLSGRLTRTDAELVWYPDRAGRRSIQIEAQLKMRVVDTPSPNLYFGSLSGINTPISLGGQTTERRSNKAWSISAEVLPVGNAVVEVETDGAWLVSVAARGRSTTPSIGKSIIQLGNQDRIEGYFQPPSSLGSRSTPLAMPSDSIVPTGDQPTMNTELLLDNDQLVARTIIEYPTNQSLAGEIEVESDSLWLPIGTQWGDATLTDVRTGSTLDRRRYTLRWNPIPPSESEESQTTPSKRSIVTTWVPTGETSLRSILFAECRDRRVRQGVLRYARSPGSIWTLDGISSWIPAINSKDRLDWPELKDPPLATNLRIPVSSGFGVLRRQIPTSPDQLVASNKIHLEDQQVRLTTTIKFGGRIGRRTPLIFEIPLGYQVDRVLSNNGYLDSLNWTINSQNNLQVLIDRQLESASEFVIEWSGVIHAPENTSWEFSFPQLKPSSEWSSPPTFQLSADPSWLVQDSSDTASNNRIQQGQGDNQSIIRRYGLPSEGPVLLSRAPEKWNGSLLIRIPDESSREGIRVYGIRFESPKLPWHGLELSLPKELAASWSSRNPITELPDLRWNHRLIAIEPDQSETASLEVFDYDFVIEIMPEFEANLDSKLIEQIGINGDFQIDKIVAVKSQSTAQEIDVKTSPLTDKLSLSILEAIQIDTSDWKLGVVARGNEFIDPSLKTSATEFSQQFAKHQRISKDGMLSEFWIKRVESQYASGSISWNIPIGWHCLMAQVDGENYPFQQTNQQLDLYYPPLDSSMSVKIWFTIDPNADVQSASAPVPSLLTSLPKGESVKLFDPRNPRKRPSATKREFNAWVETVLQQSQSSISRDHQAWHYSAEQLTRLLWETNQSTHSEHPILSSQEYAQGIETLFSLPWKNTDEYRHSLQAVSSRAGITEPSRALDPADIISGENENTELRSDSIDSRILSSLFPLFALTLFLVGWRRVQGWLQSRPWWNILSIALVWWMVTGDLWISSFFALVASILVIDSYWMITSQFRQTGIRAPR